MRAIEIKQTKGAVFYRAFHCFLISCFLLISPLFGSGQRAPDKKPKRLWSVSLAKLPDWGRFEEKYAVDTLVVESSYGRPQVEFINGKLLAVGFLYSPSGPIQHFLDPLKYKVFFFEAASGKLLKTMEWEARKDEANLLPTHDGGFVLRAGDKLMRFAPDLKLIAERRLPETKVLPPRTGTGWTPYRAIYSKVEMTPGGRTLFLRHINHDEQRNENTWVDVDTLNDTRSMTEEGRHQLVASEKACATYRPGPRPQDQGSTFLWEPDKGWREFALGLSPKIFLDDDKLLFIAASKFKVVTLEGKALYEGTVDSYLANIVVKPSISKQRFVILNSRNAALFRGPFDRKFSANVYDLESGFLVDVIDMGTHDQGEVDLALSPDGSQLVVLAGSRIQLFRLP